MGSQRVGHDWATELNYHPCLYRYFVNTSPSFIKLLTLPLLPLLSTVESASELKGKMQFIEGTPSTSPSQLTVFVCFSSLHFSFFSLDLEKVLTLFPKNSFLFTRFYPLFPLKTLLYNDDLSYIVNFSLCWLFPPSIESCSNLFNLKANNYKVLLNPDDFLSFTFYIFLLQLSLNLYCLHFHLPAAAAAAAKSLQSCPTLCDPIDGSPPGSAVPGILQARILEWVAISFSNAWKRKVKMKLLSHVQLLATPTRLLCPWIFQARVLEWGAIATYLTTL